MVYEQVYQLVNAACQQLWGTQAIMTNNLAGLISLGDKVMATNTDRDAYMGVIANRIGKTVFRTLDNRVQFPAFLKNDLEWGAVVQKINVNMLPAQQSEWANVGDISFTPTNFKIDKPDISQVLFGDPRMVWEFDLTVPDTLLRDSFTSEAKFAAFVTAIMDAMDKSVIESINALNHACLCNLIAEKFKAQHNCVNILAEYNNVASTPETAATCLQNPEFLRYLSMELDNYIEYMGETTALYNEGINNNPQLRATQRDNMHVLINSQTAKAMKFNLYNSFNYDFVKLPLYDEYVSLQGSGTTAHNWNDCTSIDVIPSSEKGQVTPTSVQQSGIVAVLADREALGTVWFDEFTGVDRNNRNRYSNYTAGCGKNYFNDLSEQAVIFYIEDTTP